MPERVGDWSSMCPPLLGRFEVDTFAGLSPWSLCSSRDQTLHKGLSAHGRMRYDFSTQRQEAHGSTSLLSTASTASSWTAVSAASALPAPLRVFPRHVLQGLGSCHIPRSGQAKSSPLFHVTVKTYRTVRGKEINLIQAEAMLLTASPSGVSGNQI